MAAAESLASPTRAITGFQDMRFDAVLVAPGRIPSTSRGRRSMRAAEPAAVSRVAAHADFTYSSGGHPSPHLCGNSMRLKVAVQMDPIERINIRGNSTFALLLEAQRRRPCACLLHARPAGADRRRAVRGGA